jgi:hypothetical protein
VRNSRPALSPPGVEPYSNWTAWLADRNATPTHLADRCRSYAHGEPHKAINADDGRLDYLARIAE